MHFRRRRGHEEPEINLIAFIDILLVIVIFLMITTTYQQLTALQVTLPTANAADIATPPPLDINVAVNAQGEYAINNVRVTATDALSLAQDLRQVAHASNAPAAQTSPMIVINADQMATHQTVIHILEAARIAGFDKVTFAAQSPVK